MSLKLVEHKIIDHEPLPLPPSCFGSVHHQVATDLCILVTCLYLWGEGRGGERRRRKRRRGMGEEGERGREGKRRKSQTENQTLYVCLLQGMFIFCKLVCVCVSVPPWGQRACWLASDHAQSLSVVLETCPPHPHPLLHFPPLLPLLLSYLKDPMKFAESHVIQETCKVNYRETVL